MQQTLAASASRKMFVEGDPRLIRQNSKNLARFLEEQGCSVSHAVRTTILESSDFKNSGKIENFRLKIATIRFGQCDLKAADDQARQLSKKFCLLDVVIATLLSSSRPRGERFSITTMHENEPKAIFIQGMTLYMEKDLAGTMYGDSINCCLLHEVNGVLVSSE